LNKPDPSPPDYSDEFIAGILESVRCIALVGASANPERPSHRVMKFLLDKGYRVIAVNPGLAGHTLLGAPVVASLGEIGEAVDMIDIFRAAEAAPGLVRDALEMNPRPRVIWMQLGVVNEEAARLARDGGLEVVMDRCPKIEYARLSSETGWAGVASHHISANRAARGDSGVQQLILERDIPDPAG